MSVLLLLAACGGLGLEPQASLDSGLDLGPVHIDGLDPSWGPTSGGTEVVISGAGFEGDVAVWFGSAELTVTVLDDTELVVSTPATSVEVPVDVEVHSDLGQAVLADGFTYSDSGPPEDSDGGADGGASGDNAGLTRGQVLFSYEVIACPSCFKVTEQLVVGAQAVFHPATSGSWLDWLPPVGSCNQTAEPTNLTSASLDVGEWVYLSTGAISHGLRRTSSPDGRVIYAVDGLGQDDWTRYADWDLSVADGGELGSMELSGVVTTTYGFDSVQPAAVLDDRGFAATLNRNSATLTWSPTDVAESVVAILDIYSGNGSNYLGRVACQVQDSGTVTWPGSMLSSYPSGALVAVFLYRYQSSDTILSVDGSTLEGLSTIGFAGTATLQ